MGPQLVRGCGEGSRSLRLRPQRRQQHGLIHWFKGPSVPVQKPNLPRAVETKTQGLVPVTDPQMKFKQTQNVGCNSAGGKLAVRCDL